MLEIVELIAMAGARVETWKIVALNEVVREFSSAVPVTASPKYLFIHDIKPPNVSVQPSYFPEENARA